MIFDAVVKVPATYSAESSQKPLRLPVRLPAALPSRRPGPAFSSVTYPLNNMCITPSTS